MNVIAARPRRAEATGLSLGSLMQRLLGRRGPATSGPHIIIQGHVNGSYSLAAVNRGLARSLERLRPGMVSVVPVEGSVTTDVSGIPAHERIDDLIRRAPAHGVAQVVISQHFPVYVPQNAAGPALALFYWEETLVPVETVRCLNRHFQGVLAPSAFVAKVLVDSGVSVPVYLVGQAPRLDDFHRLGATRRERRSEIVSFLHVSSCMARKGVDVLLAAYVRAFRRGDKVRLVIKGFPNPHNDVGARVAAIRASDPEAPEIVVINQDIDRQDMLSLYADSDVMVLPTRGEGFNLPAAEAMAAGLAVIVTGFGGQMDFCNADTARLLDYRLAPSQSHVAGSHGLWAEPCIDDLVVALREATGNPPIARARLRQAAKIVRQMTEQALVDRILRAATDCLAPSNAPAGAVLIDHDPSQRPWSALAGLVALQAEHGPPVAIRLGGSYDIEQLPAGERILALATLSRAARVIVPDTGVIERLRRLGVAANLVLIPRDANDASGEQLSGLLDGLAQEARLATWRRYEPERNGLSASG